MIDTFLILLNDMQRTFDYFPWREYEEMFRVTYEPTDAEHRSANK